MIQFRFIFAALFLVGVLSIDCVGRAEGGELEATATTDQAKVGDDDARYFQEKIRPLLAKHCYSCHSQRAIKVKGGLRLDSRQGLHKGGESGAVIVPGKPEESSLILALRWPESGLQMPPGEPLAPEQIQLFEEWVKRGAPDPRDDSLVSDADADDRSISLEEAGRMWWAFAPIRRPEIPPGVPSSTNPIDAFIGEKLQAKGLHAAGPSDRAALLRRMSLDLTGIPPTPAEQQSFLNDPSPEAFAAVVDRLLASEQHGVRYARHWLDVLRYADVDERMIAAPGIHLWRDWVVNAINDNVPYDEFVRAQLTGYRSTERTQISATGYRSKADPRPDDLFALGLLARGAVVRDRKGDGELAISAVETVSSAFLGLTVGCAKCHDHVYDPITQRDFYAMKALFDPLVTRKITLATADHLIASGRARQEEADRRAPTEARIADLLNPFRQKLYDERLAMLPDDVQAVIRKPERDRTVAELKIADDYFPILRIDTGKVTEIMPEADRRRLGELEGELRKASEGVRRSDSLSAFWTVEVDSRRELDKSFILTSGDPERPELHREVQPGWPFAASAPVFRDGRVEAFSDWLTSPENPLFARVAVNRIWQWHFGQGLHKAPSDFGKLGGTPSHPELLDWLASELIRLKFDMKAIHRLIVTSDCYQRTTQVSPELIDANYAFDPVNACLWHFPLQRLDAEAIWDSIFSAADGLDPALGGTSFAVNSRKRDGGSNGKQPRKFRRAAYLVRGFSTSRDVMPDFLQSFDVDDGRVSCPQRTQTVTASQSLFLMNSDEVEQGAGQFAERLQKDSDGDLRKAVDLGFQWALCRLPTARERELVLAHLEQDATPLRGLAWLLFNLDEFLYVK